MKRTTFEDLEKEFNINKDIVHDIRTMATAVQANIDNGPWIAGGSILRSLIGFDLKEHLGSYAKLFPGVELYLRSYDIDIWFKDLDQYQYYQEKFSPELKSPKKIEVTVNDKDESIDENNDIPKDIFVSSFETDLITNKKIQLIKYKDLDSGIQLIREFDFTCVQLFTDGKTVVTFEETLDDIRNRILRMNRFRHQPNMLNRSIKYISLGFIPDLETSYIINQMATNLKDIECFY